MKNILFLISMCIVAVNVLYAQTLEDGLVLYYTFDDPNNFVSDESGNGKNAVSYGSPLSTPDRNGNSDAALYFDGDNDYLKMPDVLLTSSSAYSASCWVRVDGQNTLSNTTASLIDFRHNYNMSLSVKTGDPTNGNKFRFFSQDVGSVTKEVYSTTQAVYGDWYHVAIVYDGNVMNLYINGILEASLACNPARAYSSGFNKLGKDYASNDRNWLLGAMDEVRIYSRALQSTEILDVYDFGNPSLQGGWYSSGNTVYNTNVLVGINTAVPRETLSVNGNIRAKEIKVEVANWPDYVFEADYTLSDLTALETFITQYKHLPKMPAAAEVAENGIALGQMNQLLLEKTEELTLYLIAQKKQMQAQQKQLEAQAARIQQLEEKVGDLKK